MMAVANGNYSSLRLTPAGESDEKKLEFIELMTARCDEVQRRVLAEILKQNRDTEYLRRHGLAGATDRASFKSKIPVANYEDLQPDIQRIANGEDSSILSGEPISWFLISSGTLAGKSKLIPTIKEELDRRHVVYSLSSSVMKKFVPGLDEGKGMYFLFAKPESKTPGGIPIRAVLTSYYKSHHFKSASRLYTSPTAAILCPESNQSMYVQMLCGLYHRLQVLHTGTVFASGFLRVIRFLQTHWPLLAADIASGTLSPSITDSSLRASVADILRPDPLLSGFITEQCSDSNWEGIITRIWPNMKFLRTIITGAMAQYIPALEFYGGGIPLASPIYGSSECCFGLNINPICTPSEAVYTLMPNVAYFEFAPFKENGEDSDELVELADVELGKEYELVITTYAGLYRYRVGDILRVARFHNSAPQFEFMRRKNVLLSIEYDKTNEADLHRAMKRATKVLATVGVSVSEYTSHVCIETVPGHYVIFWEFMKQQGVRTAEEMAEEVMERCCLEMEEELNFIYRFCRVVDRSIGPLEIRVVRIGTFEDLMEQAISRGASVDQYKVPRCVNHKSILEHLNSSVVSSHFSPKLPQLNF